MREEQKKDRDRVTRRGGTKIFGSSGAPKSAERIHVFDDDRQDAPRGGQRTRDPREERAYRDDGDRTYRDSRRYRDDDERTYREDRRYRDEEERDYRDSHRYRDGDERAYRESRRYRDEDERAYRDSRRYRDEDERAYREERRYREDEGRKERYGNTRRDRDADDTSRARDRRSGDERGREQPRRARDTDKPRAEKNEKPTPAASTANTELFAHQVVPYVMFWVALFAAVSFVLRDLAGLSASAGAFGNWLADFLCGILGIGAYLLPLFLVVLSLRWKRFVRQGLLGKKLFLSTTFLLLLSGIIHVFQDIDRARRITAPAILFAEGSARNGGGFFGGFVGEWLGFCLRLPGTCLLAIPLLLIVGIYLVGLTPSGLWQRVDAKLKMIRQRQREERGANGAKIAPSAAREALGKGTDSQSPAWKEPQPLSRSGAVMYDFREDEPEISLDFLPDEDALAQDKTGEKAHTAPLSKRNAAQNARVRRFDGVNEILDIPDDEPEIIDPSPEARTILSNAGHGDDTKRQVEDILRDMERTAVQATPAPTPVSSGAVTSSRTEEGEQSQYYAPFALPVRPEPRRERAGEQDHSHIVINPHAKDTATPQASEEPVVAQATSPTAFAVSEGEECLGNMQAAPYRPTQPQSASLNEDRGANAFGAQPFAATAYTPTAQLHEEQIGVARAAAVMDERDTVREVAEPTASVAPVRETFGTASTWQKEEATPVPGANSVFDSLFEELDEEPAEPVVPQEPTDVRTSLGFDGPAAFVEDEEEDAGDIAMPMPGVSAARERVEPLSTPAFSPAAFTAPAPARYEPPRRAVPVAKVEPVRDEKPQEPVAVRKEYVKPPLTLLNEDKNLRNDDFYGEIEETKQILRDTLESFNIHIQDEVAYSHGPSVTRYELRPVAGTSVRSVTNRIEDISLNLASLVRIEAPIPGKPAIGIEVPNKVRETVYMRTMLESPEFRNSTDPLEVPLGLDVGGAVKMCNLAKMPHLLIAGTTGSGKSVCINSILVSLIYKTSPEDLRLILIDPKQIEFAPYEHVPHLYMPIVTDMQRAAGALACAVQEMERRFTLIKDVGVRNIEAYNEAVKNDPDREHLPYMVIVIDEFADLKMSCSNNDPENFTCRIAQKARAAGIHLIIGTQRPSVDVITGKLKTNIPSRIAFMVKQQVDSRTILDANGAESLTGRGDMLYMPSNSSDKAPNRVQGAFVSDGELERVISYVRKNNDPVQYNQAFMDQIEIEMAKSQNSGKKNDLDDFADEGEGSEDPKFVEAVKLAVETQKVATSLLQRRLGVGYGRAAKIIDRMEDLGLVSAPDGNKPRQILPAAQGYLNHMAAEDEGGSDEFNDYQ
ncbi:MAG: DNA translocase FtsK 4TM domain-containing protein [Clostridia bacterium]|nr:DNA translocase FtsK 4TM domain-containing protein [Clostridia bacterium]